MNTKNAILISEPNCTVEFHLKLETYLKSEFLKGREISKPEACIELIEFALNILSKDKTNYSAYIKRWLSREEIRKLRTDNCLGVKLTRQQVHNIIVGKSRNNSFLRLLIESAKSNEDLFTYALNLSKRL